MESLTFSSAETAGTGLEQPAPIGDRGTDCTIDTLNSVPLPDITIRPTWAIIEAAFTKQTRGYRDLL